MNGFRAQTEQSDLHAISHRTHGGRAVTVDLNTDRCDCFRLVGILEDDGKALPDHVCPYTMCEAIRSWAEDNLYSYRVIDAPAPLVGLPIGDGRIVMCGAATDGRSYLPSTTRPYPIYGALGTYLLLVLRQWVEETIEGNRLKLLLADPAWTLARQDTNRLEAVLSETQGCLTHDQERLRRAQNNLQSFGLPATPRTARYLLGSCGIGSPEWRSSIPSQGWLVTTYFLLHPAINSSGCEPPLQEDTALDQLWASIGLKWENDRFAASADKSRKRTSRYDMVGNTSGSGWVQDSTRRRAAMLGSKNWTWFGNHVVPKSHSWGKTLPPSWVELEGRKFYSGLEKVLKRLLSEQVPPDLVEEIRGHLEELSAAAAKLEATRIGLERIDETPSVPVSTQEAVRHIEMAHDEMLMNTAFLRTVVGLSDVAETERLRERVRRRAGGEEPLPPHIRSLMADRLSDEWAQIGAALLPRMDTNQFNRRRREPDSYDALIAKYPGVSPQEPGWKSLKAEVEKLARMEGHNEKRCVNAVRARIRAAQKKSAV